MSKPKCPYCKSALLKVPVRKTKCLDCGKYFFVKSTPDNREKRIMTEAEALDAEAEWSEYHEHNRFVSALSGFGLTEKDLLKAQKGLFKKKPLREAYHDLLMSITEKHKDYGNRYMAHGQLALELCKAGNDFLNHLKEAAKYELLRLKSMGVKKVEISTTGEGNGCVQCQEQANIEFNIDEALESMPIPCESCTHADIGDGFCRCCYIAVTE